MEEKMGMAKRLFKPVPSTDRGEGSGGRGWRQKKQGRCCHPALCMDAAIHPFLGMQPLMPEPCSLRLAASAAALPLKGPTITL